MKNRNSNQLKPRIWQWAYLGMKPLLHEIKEFATTVSSQDRVLDVGCGDKPYASLFAHTAAYIGVEIEPGPKVDVVAPAWKLPFPDHSFDVLFSTQVLEHVSRLSETITEMQRVVKPGGKVFISAPLTFIEHGTPYDFWRFTRYGFQHLFQNFTIVKIKGLNGFLNTICRLMNTFFQYIPVPHILLSPIFLWFNVWGVVADTAAKVVLKIFGGIPLIREGYEKVYMGMPENYVVVLTNSEPNKVS